jgi:tetratricopeptide (TPR) repeat protein
VGALPEAPRAAEPVVVASAVPRTASKPARSFAVPQSLAPPARPSPPGAPPRPKTLIPRVEEPPPSDEFRPSPTQLRAGDLFDDSQPMVVQPPPSAMELQKPAAPGGGRPAAEAGLDLANQKRYSEARTKLAEALRRDPRNRVLRVAYHFSVGMDLSQQGRHDEARKQFESVLLLDPENAQAVAALRSQSSEKQAAKRSFLDGLLRKK